MMVLRPLLRKKKSASDRNEIWPNEPKRKATRQKPTYRQTLDTTKTEVATETDRTETDFSITRNFISSVDRAWIARDRTEAEPSAV